MHDGSLALQVWVVAKLKAASGLTAIVGARILGARPAQTADLPFVLIENSDAQPFGRGEAQGCSVTMQVHCWTRAGGKPDAPARARKIANEIAKALSNQRPTISGWKVAHVFVERTRQMLERDNSTAHGIVEIRADMWPAPPDPEPEEP